MWRDCEEDAIYIGLSLDEFWQLTPNEYKKYVSAYNRRHNDYIIEKDYLNYLLGQYISYAFNNPKHYPRKQFLKDCVNKNHMSSEDMERVAIRNTRLLGGELRV